MVRGWRAVSARLAAMALWATLAACGGGGGGDAGGGGGGGGSGPTLTADLSPLNLGDTNTWRVVSGPGSGSIRHERVVATATVAGQPGFEIRDTDGTVGYTANTAGGVVVDAPPTPGGSIFDVGAYQALRFGLRPGESFVSVDRSFQIDSDGDGRPEPGQLRVEVLYVGDEPLQTVLDSFARAARVRQTVTVTVQTAVGEFRFVVQTDLWLVSGIGSVRSSTVTRATGQPDETSVEELVAYRAGSRRSENVAPQVVRVSPQAGQSVTGTAALEVEFSEPVQPMTVGGTDGLVLVAAGGAAVPRPPVAVGSSGTTWQLEPGQGLAEGAYELRIGGGITDWAGNAVPATVVPFTVDRRGPLVTTSLPQRDDQDVPLSFTPSFTFDEAVSASPGWVFEFFVEDGLSGETTRLAATVQGRTVQAAQALSLKRDRPYTLQLLGRPQDAAGNVVDEFALRISFRTTSGPMARPIEIDPEISASVSALHDVDGDGRVDLVQAGWRPTIGEPVRVVSMRPGLATGGYGPVRRLVTEGNAVFCADLRALTFGDFDGNGQVDIALSGCLGGLRLFLQFAPDDWRAQSVGALPGSDWAGAVAQDGNRQTDLLVREYEGSSGTYVFRLRSRDATGDWPVQSELSPGGYPFSPQLADLNGDGRPDLIWLVQLGDLSLQLRWSLRTQAGFGPPAALPLDATLGNAVRLRVGDVTGDGIADAVWLATPSDGTGQPSLVVHRGTSSGGFEAGPVAAISPSGEDLQIGDLNHDGLLDVVVGHSAARQFGVHLQRTTGGFEAERLFRGAFGYFSPGQSLLILDYNGDSLSDVLTFGSVALGQPTAGAWPLRAKPQPRGLWTLQQLPRRLPAGAPGPLN